MRKTLAAAACVLMVASACTSGEDPQGVVESYFAAWNTRNVDDIMEYVAEDASLEIDQLGVMRAGRAEIRQGFEAMFSRSEWTIEVSDFESAGDKLNYNYVIRSPEGRELERGRSEATIEDGKIVSEELIGPYQEPAGE